MAQKKTPKTNAMRLLDIAKIPYEIIEYEVDENDLSGIHIADQVGLPYDMVFKTIVKDGKPMGAIGVIGPLRMDYARVLSTLDADRTRPAATIGQPEKVTAAAPEQTAFRTMTAALFHECRLVFVLEIKVRAMEYSPWAIAVIQGAAAFAKTLDDHLAELFACRARS